MTTELVICNHVEECSKKEEIYCDHAVLHVKYEFCTEFDCCKSWINVICTAVEKEPDWEI